MPAIFDPAGISDTRTDRGKCRRQATNFGGLEIERPLRLARSQKVGRLFKYRRDTFGSTRTGRRRAPAIGQ